MVPGGRHKNGETLAMEERENNECKCDRTKRENEFGDLVLNVGRHHFAVCKLHERYRYVGSNLFSGWRREGTRMWKQAADTLPKAIAQSLEDVAYLTMAEQEMPDDWPVDPDWFPEEDDWPAELSV
jgi:hypothetical protein